jgi:hypothetical protein
MEAPRPTSGCSARPSRASTASAPDAGRAIPWPPREVLAAADQWYEAEGMANLSTLAV